MSDISNVLSTILNKEDFVKEFLSNNVSAEVIEEEWNRVEQLFVLLYTQIAYNNLSESDKSGLSLRLSEEPSPQELSKFASKMSSFLKKNPESINIEIVTKQAAEETLKQYSNYLNEGGAI